MLIFLIFLMIFRPIYSRIDNFKANNFCKKNVCFYLFNLIKSHLLALVSQFFLHLMGGCFNLLTLQDKKNAKTNKNKKKNNNKSNLKGCGSNYFVSFINFMSALNFICLALNADITWNIMHHVHLMALMVQFRADRPSELCKTVCCLLCSRSMHHLDH